MQKLEQGIYTRQQIINQLHMVQGSNFIKFRYDLLNYGEKKIGELDTVVDGEVNMNSLADIKRTARVTLKEGSKNINWLSNKIQPFFMLRMPDGNFVEWSLGIFMLCSPTRKKENNGIYREVECYDTLQVLKDDKFDTRYAIAQGANYITAIINILSSSGITKYNLEQTTLTLPATVEWEPGTEKLAVINELLQQMNYTSLWVNEWGIYTASKYVSPSSRAAEYTYEDNYMSILGDDVEEELDLFCIPNKWVAIASNPETTALSSSYTNSNADSLTSTVNRGRTIVDYRTIDKIADQASLNAYVQKIAFEASQIYGNVNFPTALMPHHSYADVIQVKYNPLNLVSKYSETSWLMQLKAGAMMQHTVRKVVNI